MDPVAGRILADLAPIDHVVAAGPWFVWALDDPWGPNPGLVRIDTETNAVAPLGDAPDWPWLDFNFAVADGALWAFGAQPGTIFRLDPVTGEVEGEIDVVPSPGPITGGGGAVWAADGNDGTLARYDIATGQVETIVVGGKRPTISSSLAAPSGWRWRSSQRRLARDDGWGARRHRHASLTVDGVPFSFNLHAGAAGRDSVTSRSTRPRGGAECGGHHLLEDAPRRRPRRSVRPLRALAADLATAAATAPGTELVTGPTDVTVGGHAAKHVVLTVREDLGCDPGYFFTWQAS